MSCQDILIKVSAYVDGELPSEERAEVEAHLGLCQSCSQAAQGFRRLDDSAAQEKAPRVTGEEWARMWEVVGARAVSREELPQSVTEDPLLEIEEEAVVEAASPEKRGVVASLWESRGTESRGTDSRGARFRRTLAAAAAVLVVGTISGIVLLRGPGVETVDPTQPPQSPEKTDDYATHLSGPEPEIIVDPEDGTTHLKYDEF